jgi:cytochrome oxidase Cu insertion factor (SCO1/SenC/PrrC family)
MSNSATAYSLAFAVLASGAYAGYKVYEVSTHRPTGDVVAPQLPPLTDFELTDQSGEPVRSADLKGKVWVASFFFSTCPSSCGRLNANIKAMSEKPELDGVTWLSITVDPETDTVERLAEYAHMLNADGERWHFCRHDDFSYVKRLANDVFRVGGVSFKGHNDYVVVIDRNGEIAGMFNGYNMLDLARSVEVMKQCLAAEPKAEAEAESKDEPEAKSQDEPEAEVTAEQTAEAA